jgi:hypothetical protein
MDLHPQWGTADFLADMTMCGFGTTASGAVDPAHPLVNPHTHHIRLTNAKITWDMTGCPTYMGVADAVVWPGWFALFWSDAGNAAVSNR